MKVFRNLKAAFVLARSLKRIADALEDQNRIRKIEMEEIHGIVVPDPTKKWSKKETEVEVSYGEVATDEDQEMADRWRDENAFGR